jgi:hypothetical protein
MPMSVKCCFALSFLVRWSRPVPRRTLGALLNILIINDLNAVAPGIAEVEERHIELYDAGRMKRATGGFLIINN